MPEAPNDTHLTLQEKNTRALEFIEDVTSNADLIQTQVLADILSWNAEVEYLRCHPLLGRTDPASYKTSLPVISYDDISDDISRIANGDPSPISEFLSSSGTSGGERKLMPTIAEELDWRTLLYSLLMPVMSLNVPGLENRKGMYFLFVKLKAKTPLGLPARPVLTSYYKSAHFRERLFDPYTDYTSPERGDPLPGLLPV